MAVVFVVVVERVVGWQSIVYPWRFLDEPLWMVAGAGLVVCSYVLRTVRVYRFFDLTRAFPVCLRVMLQHILLVNLLPFRSGEFAFPVLMHRHFSTPPARSVPGLLWLRMLDLHVLVLMLIAVAGLVLSAVYAAVAAVLWIAAVFAVQAGAFRIAAALPEGRGRLVTSVRSAFMIVPSRPSALLESWLLTLSNWLLKLGIFAWVLHLFTSAAYDVSLAGAIGGELTAILPIHGVAGAGTYEAGVVVAMQALGSTINEGLTGAVNLHLFMLGVSVAAGAASLLLPAHRSSATGRA